MRKRTFATLGGALLVVLVTAAVTYATVSQYVARPLNRQNLGYITGPRTMSATTFKDMAGWGFSDGMTIEARAGFAATLSATVHGGPVQFRLYIEDVKHHFKQRIIPPGIATFNPGSGTESTSFTWVAEVAPGAYTVNITWRSPTGAPVTFNSGTLVVQYGAEKP
jgi:hypothetical protein